VRVAHLVIDGEVAGGQLVALQLAHALRDRGDDAVFVSPTLGAFTERAEAEGFRVVHGDVRRLHRLRGMLALSQRLHDEEVDLLHTHTLAAANALGRLAARWAKIPSVSHLHIENYFRPATRWLLRGADNRTARSAAALVAVSEDTKRAYERQGYPKRIEVVYNGVPLDGAEPSNSLLLGSALRAELGIPDGAPLVGEIGRLCDVKGQRELIAALAQLPDARAVLVGADIEQGGAFQTSLEDDAERLGVRDRVVFTGRRDDTTGLLAELDVLALPSWTEGLPLVVLEAMAQRRPVVATPVGGTPEVVVDGETGLLVPPRDPDALAAALRRLLADPGLRQRMGEAGYERVRERFSADAMTRRVLAIYDEVLR
jgi:glycosyltransferase involved in cell wall biosynthesis